MPGRLIAFEGGEGCGKSTQARLLAEALIAEGISVDLTREPGGTPGAEAIRGLLLHPPGEGWRAEAEALLFAAARSDHVARRVIPALEAGDWVVCDRFVASSLAYQGGAGGVGDDAVIALHKIGSGGIQPDLTILLDVDENVAMKRTRSRDGDAADAIGGRGREYHCRVREAFTRLAREESNRFAIVPGDAETEIVHQLVWRAVMPLVVARS